MKKIVGGVLILVTIITIIAGAVLTVGALSFNSSLEIKTHEINENYNKVNISVTVEDINIYLSNNNENKVICKENEQLYFKVEVVNGTLNIENVDERKFYNRIISFYRNSLEIYLSNDLIEALNIEASTCDITVNSGFVFNTLDVKNSTGDISLYSSVLSSTNITNSTGDIEIKNSQILGNMKVFTSTGDIEVSSANANSLDISTSTGEVDIYECKVLSNINIQGRTGDIELKNTTCYDLAISLSTGEVSLIGLIALNNIDIEGTTGDVLFTNIDALNITVNLSTGDVEGTILTSKFFIAKSDTGRVIVPETREGGECRITVITGDINISYK